MSIPHYRVVTVPSPPFVVERPGGGYGGFMVDVLTRVAETAGFNFTVYPSKDGQYGSLQENNHWTGMVGEVSRKEAVIAASDLSITRARSEVVDFTSPVLEQTTRMLMRKPAPYDPIFPLNLGFLFEPFSKEIWMCILAAALFASLLFMVIGQFNPYEWRQVPSDKDPRGARHSFGLRDSLMFVFSSLFLQGYRETPRSLSGRTLAVSWFIFVFFVVVAYVGGVVSFTLAGEREVPSPVPFQRVTDLASQSRIKVGVIRGGRTFRLLENNRNEDLSRLAAFIVASNSSVDSLNEGLQTVREHQDFVMLTESLRGEHIVNRNCDLMLLGPGIFPQRLGFAVARRSPLLDAMNTALLELMEDGTIEMLKRKWWTSKRGCGPSPSELLGGEDTERVGFSVSQLQIHQIAAPFFLLAAGAILAIVFLIVEVIFKKVKS